MYKTTWATHHDFAWAVQMMEAGEKVARFHWIAANTTVVNGEFIMTLAVGTGSKRKARWSAAYEDVNAKDWGFAE